MLITFIGGGNMATALISGLTRSREHGLKIRVSDPSDEVRIRLQSTYEIEVFSEPQAAVKNADVIVLAVKPQIIPLVLDQLRTIVEAEQLVLSIAAGTTIDFMAGLLQEGQAIIRAMPNTPALVGEGITGMCPGQHCRQHHCDQAEKILSAAGEVIWLESESLMDAVTAISGSGPAYFFLLTESLTRAGVKLGLEEGIARRLAEQTCIGAGVMMKTSDMDAAELRKRVTSPGGTTQAALESFYAEDFVNIVHRATAAAERRGKQLSQIAGEL
jgi:pyrroline-5-carboxylate reductase